MSTTGTFSIGVESLASTVARAEPTVVASAPVGSISTPTATAAWSYSSPVSRAQASFQVQLRSGDGSVTLYDSGIRAGADTSYAISFLLSGGSSYLAYVRATDGLDWSTWSIVYFTAEEVDPSMFPLEPSVGSVFEIGINGTGYMLADSPEVRVERRTSSLEPPRFATSSTPFTEAIERYTFVGSADMKAGAGQRYLDREGSVGNRFWDSQGINPFEDDCIQLLPATTRSIESAHTAQRMVVASGLVFVQTGAKELQSQTAPGGTVTTFSVAAAGTVSDATSDGTRWYVCDGANVFRGATAADPGAAWSTVSAELIEWCSDRIAAVYTSSGAAVFSTLSPTGVEEVALGRFSFAGATIPDLTSGDGYVWFPVNRTDSSEIRAWRLGGEADSVSFTALTLPAGERATALGFYLGNVFVRTVETLVGGGTRCVVYRCVPQEGVLIPERVLEFESSTVDHTVGGFAGDDRFVAFSWPAMTDVATGERSGIGVIDLSSGGWAKWMYPPGSSATGVVRSVARWNGRFAFTVDGYGLCVEGTSALLSGWLKTSVTDQASGLTKVYDEVSAVFDPLPSSSSVSVGYSRDVFNSVAWLDPWAFGAGTQTFTWPIARNGRSVGLQVQLTATGGTSPKLRVVQLKLHPLPLSDRLVVFPVNCADQLAGLNGQTLPVSSPGAGMKRARALEALISSRIQLQDIDWPVTGATSVWEVADVRVFTNGVFAQKEGRRVDSAVAVVTLRRPA